MKPIRPKEPCKAINVHNPPSWHQRVKSPCASGPHKKSRECAIAFDGVDTAAVKKLHPSKYDEANPCVYHDVTNVVPVNHPPTAKYAFGKSSNPDQPINTKR